MGSLAILGTASGVGKSTLVAAFCRLLRRDGRRVAPFKAVNISLNSAVTPDGLEIGRAQALQARAAGLEPRVEMNPVLLKPGRRRHAIVNGRPSTKMDVWPDIRRAFRALRRDVDDVVIEGSGAAAEPNLLRRDLANLRIVREAKAPVVLVGDIEPGGVFASLLGTFEILPRDVRPRAFLINRYRGRARDLAPAVRWLERRTGVPVLGVVPWLDLALDEEDAPRLAPARGGRLRVAVVRLPHLSNSTDFEPLQREPDVDLVWAERPVPCDVLIFPGTRETLADLEFVRARGFDRAIEAAPEVVGICGGLQMLGRRIVDAVEGRGDVEGLGVFDAVTRFAREKRTSRVRGIQEGTGEEIEGYEIRHGRTRFAAGRAPFARLESGDDGVVTARGWGTYVHGVFDRPGFRRAFLNRLRARRGWAARRPLEWSVDAELDRLADVVAASVDLKFVKRLLGMALERRGREGTKGWTP